MILFLNRFRIFRLIQKRRLEVPRTQRGRVSERNVEVGWPQGVMYRKVVLQIGLVSQIRGSGSVNH